MRRHALQFSFVCVTGVGGCSNPSTEDTAGASGETNSESGTEVTSAVDSGETGGGSATEDGDGDGDGDGGDGDGDLSAVRFLVIGDTGEGNEAQYAVGAAAATICELKGCEFALLLGDNFYDIGVDSVTDVQFIDKFELPYADLLAAQTPFYVVLGNHDYGELASNWELGTYQVDYGAIQPLWRMPDAGYWYDFRPRDDVHFFAFDTARIMGNEDEDVQKGWLNAVVGASDARWKVTFAHHPLRSNGEHGNAGNYEGLGILPDNILYDAAGKGVREVFDDVLCGRVDVYFSGHDHNRQSFSSDCGIHSVVSGAGAKVTDFAYRDDNSAVDLWGDDQRPGFMWVEINLETDVFKGEWYDLDGNLDYIHSFSK
jgi:predicted phosphodiesterase